MLQIGKLAIMYNVILAPMAGITDHPFRQICREEGCELVCTEMLSARGLLSMPASKLAEIADFTRRDKPISVQLLGREPEIMAQAARLAEAEMGADIIDINMGCPAKKVLKNREGAYLIQEPLVAAKVMEAVLKAVRIPVTIKTRIGWDENNYGAAGRKLAGLAEKVGISAVYIHGRTVAQGFRGKADWQIIREIKTETSLPVIGSGDVYTPAAVKNLLEYSRCDGILIGRGAFGNPWIFSRSRLLMETGYEPPAPELTERIEKTLHHLQLLINAYGEYRAAREMRKHAHWYMKGFHGTSALRNEINKASSQRDFQALLANYIAKYGNEKSCIN